jgi:hypothetical protein
MSTDIESVSTSDSFSIDRAGLCRMRERAMAFAKFCIRPTSLLIVLLMAHLCSRLALHRTSAVSGAHNFDRMYGISLSLMAGRGFDDIAADRSAASAPLVEFFELRRSGITQDEFATYLASKPDATKDTQYRWYMPLASTRILDVRLAALLWRIFGIDRRVLTTFYSLLSVATCAGLFFIARRLSGSGWAGLAASGLLTISPIEGFLNTWSWRDVSPMWFTALAFAWFTCGLQRWRRPWVNNAAYVILGVLAVVGIGWRIDCLLMAPFLGAALVVWLISQRSGWRQIVLAALCFSSGAIVTRAAISLAGPAQRQTPNIGFHMAFYSDYQRSQILGIENTFQVQFSDANTLDEARQMYMAEHPHTRQLAYLSPEYCGICRRMFFEALDFNLYRWIHGAPSFYVQALSGLEAHSMIFESGTKQIQQGLESPLRQLFRIGNKLERWMPMLLLFGVLATICVGRSRTVAALLALFSVYYAAVMFLVLPDQKHLGMMLVPLYVFAGIGISALLRLARRSTWTIETLAALRHGALRFAIPTLTVGLVWVLACSWARGHSVACRAELLSEINRRAAHGTDAPDTIRGGRNFTVAIRPDSADRPAGYLLTIAAGAKPGALVCRENYFPRDWATMWGRSLLTRHDLAPNREQSFFVSCLQGSQLNDPCPHLCTVALEGDARITRSVRVDLHDWNHPQVCTLFFAGQKSPGSPTVAGSPADWMYASARPFADPYSDPMLTGRVGLSELMPADYLPPYAGRPLCHLIGQSTDTAVWKIAMSDGWRFHFGDLNYWSPTNHWLHLKSGDFNGDGMSDLVGQAPDGQWWLAEANGAFHTFNAIDSFPEKNRYDFVGVGDFNGDCMDDLILRSTSGGWSLAISNGVGFNCRPIEGLPTREEIHSALIAGSLGNGRSQLALLDSKTGRLTIGGVDGGHWQVVESACFPPGVDWQHVTAGDFYGNGRAAIAAWNPRNGQWTVARFEGNKWIAESFGNSESADNWRCVQVARFGANHDAGLIAIDAKTGELVFASSDGKRFSTRKFAAPEAFHKQFYVGAFSGGPRDELLGIAKNGALWIAKLDSHDKMHFALWGRWPECDRYTNFQTVGFWPDRSPKR